MTGLLDGPVAGAVGPWLSGIYFALLGVLSVYGLHRFQLLILYSRGRRRPARIPSRLENRPSVTVQLPLYNELYVAGRLIEAAAAFDWPRDRLEIQVLDDSTDGTSEVAGRAVAAARARGVDIHHIRRSRREGFKAGALAEGMERSRGEFLAVFDADFVPAPDFLLRLMPEFADPAVGMVQARWEHLNRDWSLLTRVQALLLDGHFVIEHAARCASGRFFNFNGTGGIWRRSCVESAGGWQHDTLTEDLDLSYRAQMRGWRFVYLPGASAPAELPVEMEAFLGQQHRWAKGSIQTARKLLVPILRAPLPVKVKAEAFLHLTANVSYPLMLVLSLLVFPVMMHRQRHPFGSPLFLDLPLFFLSTGAVGTLYASSQRALGRSVWKTLALLPAMMAVGVGLSVSNSGAVLEGLWRRGGEFRRTPKYKIEGASQRTPLPRIYSARRRRPPFVETVLALAFSAALIAAAEAGLWHAIPFLALFWWGYSFTTVLSLVQDFGTPSERARSG